MNICTAVNCSNPRADGVGRSETALHQMPIISIIGGHQPLEFFEPVLDDVHHLESFAKRLAVSAKK